MYFFIIILGLIEIFNCVHYNIYVNKNLNSYFTQNFLIKSLTQLSHINCLAKCNQLDDCLSLTFDNLNQKCQLFTRNVNFNSLNLIDDISKNVYSKKGK
jgi:hypothetical protein